MIGYGIKETTTTTGTGTLTLSAVTGYPRFSSAFGDSEPCLYSILDSSGLPIECGQGTYIASNTLARTYPMVTWDGATYTKVNPSAISLASGTKTVICTGIPGYQGRPFPGVNSSIDSTKTLGGSNYPFTNTTGAVTALRMYVIPFELASARPITAISCRVSVAAGAGKVLRMGMYLVRADGSLGKLYFQSTDIAADGSAGVKTYSLPSATYYPPGFYALAFVSDGTPTMNMTQSNPVHNIFGVDSSNLPIQGIYVGLGSIAMPDPFSGSITTVSQGSIPYVHLRA